MTRLLRVTTPHFVAGVVFEKIDGGDKYAWFAIRAAPILGWAIGWRAIRFHEWLNSRGHTWEWVKETAGES